QRRVGALVCALLACLLLAACGAAPTQRPASPAGSAAPGMTLVVMGASDAYGERPAPTRTSRQPRRPWRDHRPGAAARVAYRHRAASADAGAVASGERHH